MKMTINELVKTMPIFGRVVKFKDQTIPEYTCQYRNRFSSVKVEPETVITNMYRYDSDSWYLHYYDNTKNQESDYVVVPNTLEIDVVDIQTVKPDLSKFKKWCIETLSQRLGYSGSIGSDPEMFIENGKGKIIPAFKFLPSKKEAQYFCKNYESLGHLFWDGFQAEFDVQNSTCMDSFTGNLQVGLHSMLQAAKKYDPTAKISLKSIIDISKQELENTAPEFLAFGCAPSLNVYGMKGLQMSGEETTLRTAGGHIHFGVENAEKIHNDPTNIVKALDAVLAVACVSLFANIDNPRRRQMYGLAGEYRLPKHGLEYRTLSNAWLCHPLIAHIVFDLARSAFMLGRRDLIKFWKGNSQETIDVVNNHKVDKAREILIRNKEMFNKIINARYKDETKTNFVFNIIMNGVESIVNDPHDIEKNWKLEIPYTGIYIDEGKRVLSSYKLNKKV